MFKASYNYLNPYEAVKTKFQGNPLFSEEDWITKSRRGELDEYATLLEGAAQLPSIYSTANSFNYSHLDTDSKVTLLYNELYGDKETIREYPEIEIDEETGEEVETVYKGTEYAYIRKLLKQRSDWAQQDIDLQIEQDRKDSLSSIRKFGATLASIPAELTKGFGDSINSTIELFGAIEEGLDYWRKGHGTFDEGYRNAYKTGKYRIQALDTLRDAINEYERKESYFMNVDGSYTTLGKYLGGTFSSIGNMLPSILLRKGFAAIKAPAALGTLATGQYYGAMLNERISQRINDENFASIPTSAIVAEAGLQTMFDYVIEQGTAKILGGSMQDKLVLGVTPNLVKGGVLSRVLHDAAKEGLEEVMQDYSSHFVSQWMATSYKEFGDSEFTIQSFMDSFLLGAMSSIFLTNADILFTKRQDVGTVDVNGKPVKLGKFNSWKYNINLQNLFDVYDNILKDTSYNSEQNSAAIQQMYIAYKTINSITGEFGENRTKQALAVLDKMSKYSYTPQVTKEIATSMVSSLILKSKNFTVNIEKDIHEIARDIPEADIKEIHEIFEAVEVKDDEIQSKTLTDKGKEAVKTIATNSNFKKIVLTDGRTLLYTEEAVFVPLKMANNVDGKDIVNHAAENELVEVLKRKLPKNVLDDLVNLYKAINGVSTVTQKLVMQNLLFNPAFYNIALSISYEQMYNVLSNLHNIAKSAFGKKLTNDVYANVINKVLNTMRTSLCNYLKKQQVVNLDTVRDVLTEEQIKDVNTVRNNKNLANRLCDSNVKDVSKLSGDITVIDMRINAMPVEDRIKQQLKTSIRHSNASVRRNALMVIDNSYNNVFFAPYDNKIYRQELGIADVELNIFMEENNVNLTTLFDAAKLDDATRNDLPKDENGMITRETIINYRKEQFHNFSKGQFDLIVENNGVIMAMSISKIGKTYYDDNEKYYKDMLNPKGRVAKLMSTNTDGKVTRGIGDTDTRKYINGILKPSVDDVTKGYIQINDIVRNPEKYVDDAILQQIKTDYETINANSTYQFLRDYFMEHSEGTVSLTKTKQNKAAFVSVALMSDNLSTNALNSRNDNPKATNLFDSIKKDGNVKISNFINRKQLQGKLADIKVYRSDIEESYYNPTTNAIYIAEKYSANSYFTFSVLHEFQHAVQHFNNFTSGFNDNITISDTMLADIMQHVPSLFNDSMSKLEKLVIAREFIYYTTGEADAYMQSTEYKNLYPTISTKEEIVMPWGTHHKRTYKGKNAMRVVDMQIDAIDEYGEVTSMVDKDIWEKYEDAITTPAYDMPMLTNQEIASLYEPKFRYATNDWIYHNLGYSNPYLNALANDKRKALYDLITPTSKMAMLKVMHANCAPGVPFEDFLEMDWPFIRYQPNTNIPEGTEFVSACMHLHLKELGRISHKPMYWYIGSIKPKDMIGYLHSILFEGLIPVSYMKTAKVVAAKNIGGNLHIIDPAIDVPGSLYVDIQHVFSDITKAIYKYTTTSRSDKYDYTIIDAGGNIRYMPFIQNADNKPESLFAILTAVLKNNPDMIANFNSDLRTKYDNDMLFLGVDVTKPMNKELKEQVFSNYIGIALNEYYNHAAILAYPYEYDGDSYYKFTIPETFNLTTTDSNKLLTSIRNEIQYIIANIASDNVNVTIFANNIAENFTLTVDTNIADLMEYLTGKILSPNMLKLIGKVSTRFNYEKTKGAIENKLAKLRKNTIQKPLPKNTFAINNDGQITYYKTKFYEYDGYLAAHLGYSFVQDNTIGTVPMVWGQVFDEYVLPNYMLDKDGNPSTIEFSGLGIIDKYSYPIAKFNSLLYVLKEYVKLGVKHINYSDSTQAMLAYDGAISDFSIYNHATDDISDIEHNLTKLFKLKDTKITNKLETVTDKFDIAEGMYDPIEIVDSSGNEPTLELQKTKYIPNKVAAGTNLEGFIRKNKTIQLHPDVQSFVLSTGTKADLQKLEKEVRQQIEDGTLTRVWMLHYLRTADKINDYTFKLINKAFFNNEFVKTFDDVRKILANLPKYYAIAKILDAKAWEYYADKQLPIDDFFNVVDKLSDQLGPKLDAVINKLYKYGKKDIEIDFDSLVVSVMRYFDGSIDSTIRIATTGRTLAILNWNTGLRRKGVSVDKQVSESDDRLRIDLIENKEYNLEDIVETKSNIHKAREILIQHTYDKLKQKIIDEGTTVWNTNKVRLEMQRRRDIVENFTDEQVIQKYVQLGYAEISGRYLTEKESEEVILTRPRINVVTNVKKIGTKIANRLVKAIYDRLPTNYKNMFELNSDRKPGSSIYVLKQSLYNKVDKAKLLELEDELKQMYSEVYNNMYSSAQSSKIAKDLAAYNRKVARQRTQIDRLKEEKAKLQAKKTESKETITELKEKNKALKETVKVTKMKVGELKKLTKKHSQTTIHTFEVASTVKMPEKLKKILETTYNKYNKSKVQFVANGKENMRIQATNFYTVNAEILSNLTEQDVNDIITYYKSDVLLFGVSDDDSRIFYSYQLLVLSHIKESVNNGSILLSAEQITALDNMLANIPDTSATLLAVWRTVLGKINPTKTTTEQMAAALGIELDDKDLDDLYDATHSGDIKKMQQAESDIYSRLLVKYKAAQASKSKSQRFWEKLLKFHKAMMLSSPATMIRNQISDASLTVGNNLADMVGNFITKPFSKYKKGQDDLAVVKVSTDIANFIKVSIQDTRLLKLIQDGLSKLTFTHTKTQDGADAIMDAIATSIKNKILSKHTYDNATANKLVNFIFKMQSDDAWTAKKTYSYLGKIIAIRNLNINKGITVEIANAIAEAYKLATFDFMRKPNVFTKLESTLKYSSPGAYVGYKLVLPFMSSAWNWFQESLNWTPLGIAKGVVDLMRLEHKINVVETARQQGKVTTDPRFTEYLIKRNIGKGVIGSFLLGLGILLGALGWIDIDRKDDKLKIRVGDTAYIDISKVFGTSALLIGAQLSNPKEGDWLTVAESAFNTMMDDSMFSQFASMFRYNNSVWDLALNTPTTVLQSFVPNFLRAFNKTAYNRKIKYSSGFKGALERTAVSMLPIGSLFPSYIDVYTGEVQTKYKVPFIIDFINMWSPVKYSDYNISDIEQLAVSLGVNKANLTGKYEDIGNLDATKLNTKYGELNKKYLQEFIDNKIKYKVEMPNGKYQELTYNQMTNEQRKNVLERIMSQNAKLAKIYVWTSDGKKYYASNTEYNLLRNAGITQRVFKGDKGFA